MARRREEQALKLLQAGPLPTRQIATSMGISLQHAGTVLRALRRAERIAIVDCLRAAGSPQNVWGILRRRRQNQFAPLQAKEEREAIRERWMYGILDQWCRFMRAYWGPMGYPTHSPGMAARARIQSFDDLADETDRRVVVTCDASIDSLPDLLRSAIYFRYGLLDVWTGPSMDDTFESATERLMALLDSKLCAP